MLNDHMQRHEATMTRRLAADHAVSINQVVNLGRTDHLVNSEVLCGACRERMVNAPLYLEPIEPMEIPYRIEFTVRLEPKLRVLDNQLFCVYWVLAGQCQDCGLVYFQWYLDTRRYSDN